jgi:hypothetical protein
MKTVVAAVLLAASLAVPATAHADCGDPGQDPCTGPVPTVDQVVAVLAELTDPNIPAANKGNIVSPGFSPDEAGTIDDHLSRMRAYPVSLLPPNFVVIDIQPAPNNSAGATVATTGGIKHATDPRPIVLNNQGGHWLIANDSAMTVLGALWDAAEREVRVCHPHLACVMR